MIKCSIVLFSKAFIKFYPCFSATIAWFWRPYSITIRCYNTFNAFIRQSFRFPF